MNAFYKERSKSHPMEISRLGISFTLQEITPRPPPPICNVTPSKYGRIRLISRPTECYKYSSPEAWGTEKKKIESVTRQLIWPRPWRSNVSKKCSNEWKKTGLQPTFSPGEFKFLWPLCRVFIRYKIFLSKFWITNIWMVSRRAGLGPRLEGKRNSFLLFKCVLDRSLSDPKSRVV